MEVPLIIRQGGALVVEFEPTEFLFVEQFQDFSNANGGLVPRIASQRSFREPGFQLGFFLFQGSQVFFQLFQFLLLFVGELLLFRRQLGGRFLCRSFFCFGFLFCCKAFGIALFGLSVQDILAVPRVGTHKVFDAALAFEDEEVIGQLVQEEPVVGYDEQGAREVLEVLFQDVEGHDVQVVGRLVKDEEVGALHQDGQEVEPAFFTATEFLNFGVVGRRGEEEAVEEGRGSEGFSIAQGNGFGDVPDDVDDGLVGVELNPLLAVVADVEGGTPVDFSGGGFETADKQVEKGAFAHTVTANEADFFSGCKVVGKVFQSDEVFPSVMQVTAVDDFFTQAGHAGLDFQGLFVDALGGPFLQVVKRINTVFGFGSAGTGHAAHPIQFRPEQVAGLVGLRFEVLDAFFAFFQEVGVVAGVAMQRAFGQFQNLVADSVQEVAVVGDHQQGATGTRQVVFQEFDAFQVQVVGRFIHDQEFGLADEHGGNRNAFAFPAAEGVGRLFEVPDLQCGQNLPNLVFVVPGVSPVHGRHRFFEAGRILGGQGLFVFPDDGGFFVAAFKNDVVHRLVSGIGLVLFQEGDRDVP